MPFEVIWEDRGVKCLITGDFSNEVVACNEAISTDPRFLDTDFAIFDFTEAESFSVESAAIRRTADMDTRLIEAKPSYKVALICSQAVATGLMRMYQSYFKLSAPDAEWGIEIFTSEEDARHWIKAEP